MSELPDISGETEVERHPSPNGRIVLDLWIDDGEDSLRFRGGPYRRPRVFEAASGRMVIDLFLAHCLASFEWLADGGLELRLGEVAVHVAPDGRSWSSNIDGWAEHTAGADNDLLMRRIEFDWSKRPQVVFDGYSAKPRRGSQWIGTLQWVVLAAVLVGFALSVRENGWRWPRQYTVQRGQAVNAWLPRCPEPVGPLILTLDRDRDVLMVRRFGGHPLPDLARLPGEPRRYGDGRVMVEPRDNGSARVWPEGLEGDAIECASQRPAGS